MSDRPLRTADEYLGFGFEAGRERRYAEEGFAGLPDHMQPSNLPYVPPKAEPSITRADLEARLTSTIRAIEPASLPDVYSEDDNIVRRDDVLRAVLSALDAAFPPSAGEKE